MPTFPSQLCLTTKLADDLGVRRTSLALEVPRSDPLATWYADLFRFERHKCLLLLHPASGYAVVVANVTRKTILNFQAVLADRLERTLLDDGLAEGAAARGADAVRGASLARTGDRSARARLVKAVSLASVAMGRSPRSDPDAMSTYAANLISWIAARDDNRGVRTLAAHLGVPTPSGDAYPSASRDVCVLRAEIVGIVPSIWRRLVIKSNSPLHAVHAMLQAAFGWHDYHLHSFEAGLGVYADHSYDPDPASEDERRVVLLDLMASGGGEALYRYDFGDNWQVKLIMEERIRDNREPVPRCLDGEMAGPPEDVGGINGYAQMLAALAKRSGSNAKMYREWLPEGWTAERFSTVALNDELRELSDPLGLLRY